MYWLNWPFLKSIRRYIAPALLPKRKPLFYTSCALLPAHGALSGGMLGWLSPYAGASSYHATAPVKAL